MDGPEDRTHLGTLGTPRSPSSQARFSRLMTQQTLSSFQTTYHAWHRLEGPDLLLEAAACRCVRHMALHTCLYPELKAGS